MRSYYHARYRPRGLRMELPCVIKGKMLVTLYEINSTLVRTEVINEGYCIVMRRVYTVKFLKDSVLLEVEEGSL